MDIFLSVNNRAEILQIPVMPPSFTVSKPQTTEKFETVSGEELLLIGSPKLKGIGWESFFPIRDYPFLKHSYNSDMWGWDYIYMIDTWIKQKLPIRLIITYDHKDTSINMPTAVSSFEYELKSDGDLWYKIQFEELNLMGYDNPIPWYGEEEIDMEELNKLKEQVEYLTGVVEELANPMIYDYIDNNMPEWARESVQKLYDAGIIKGSGIDESGFPTLGLDYLTLRLLVIIDRAMQAGAFN